MASLVLDRFVSASSSADAHASLESILEALKNNRLKTNTAEDNNNTLPPELIWKEDDILSALRHVLHTGRHKLHDMQVPVEEGASLVCQIYLEILQQDSKCPLLERDPTVLECLIDVISDTVDGDNDATGEDDDLGAGVSMYTRVLALQLLTELCKKRSSQAQTQLLAAGVFLAGGFIYSVPRCRFNSNGKFFLITGDSKTTLSAISFGLCLHNVNNKSKQSWTSTFPLVKPPSCMAICIT